MLITYIVKCPKCGKLMLTRKNQKTKTCPNCNAKVNLIHSQKIASAANSFEASEILRQLKAKDGFKKS